MVTFDTVMSEKDFRSLTYFTLFSKHSWVPGMMILGMALALLVVVNYFLGPWTPTALLLAVAIGYIVLILGLLGLTERHINQAILKQTVPIGVRQRISVDRTGMDCALPGTDKKKKYLWENVEQIYETPEYFVIYIGARGAFVFNKGTIGNMNSLKFHKLLCSLNLTKYNDRTEKKHILRRM